MRVEVVDGLPFGFGGGLPRGFPALERALALVARGFVAAQRGADELAVPQVAGFFGGACFEIGNERAHAARRASLNC